MKSFLLFILIISLCTTLNLFPQNITAKLAGHSVANGFTVTDDEDKVLFKITGEGNVGINTDVPTSIFDVQGGVSTIGVGRGINIIAESGAEDFDNSGGDVLLKSGNGLPPFNSGASILINGGGTGDVGANIDITPGRGPMKGGNVNIIGGEGEHGGDINIETSGDNFPGDIMIRTATSNVVDGSITLWSQGTYGGGGITLRSSNGGEGSPINIITGDEITGDGFGTNINLTAGDGYGANIVLTPGFDGENNGLVKIMGSGTYTGTWAQASDVRFKKNIEPLQNSLDKIEQLNGVSYELRKDEFIEKNFSDGRQIGLIAQEVEKVFPELVRTDGEGYKSVDYSKLSVILLEGIKLQQKELVEQSNKISELEKRIINIENKISSQITTVSN